MKRTLALTGAVTLVLSLATAAAAQEHGAPEPPDPLEVVEVSASGSDGNLPEGTLDGFLDTRWSAETVDPDNPQWIQFDLGTVTQIGYLGVAWHQGDLRQAFFDLAVSDDGQQWQTVLDGAASSGTELDLEPVTFADAGPQTGVSGRYLRYLGYGNTNSGWNSLTEVRLYPPHPDGAVVHSFAGNIPEPDPDAEPYTAPGFTEPDGSPRPLPPRHEVTGQRLDVTDFGADPADSGHDDAPAINAAIEAAEPGDEVYLPAGVYHLRSGVASDNSTNVALRSRVNLRGAGQEETVLRSWFTQADANGKVVRGYGVTDLVISDLTVSSTFDGPFSDNPNADAGGGPQYGIFLSDAVTRPSQRIHIERVTVERFERMGIRIASSQDVVVSDSLFRDATSVGGGGRGYGVSIQGIAKTDRLGFPDDSRHNVVRRSTFEGPYLRHGALLQFVTHNNLVADNQFRDIVLDAVDLHGEGEYLNEVRGNRFDGARAAAIALGNTGGTPPSNHSAAGPGNWIHRNVIRQTAREGIKVHMGSPETLIERNTITGLAGPSRWGIQILNAPGTVVRQNSVTGNQADRFWGIHLGVDPGDSGAGGVGAGVPTGVTVTGNTVVNNTGGVLVEAGESVTLHGNTVRGNEEDIRLDIRPPADEGGGNGGEPPPGALMLPTDDSMIDNGAPDTTFGDATLLKWKQNVSGSIQRIAYYRFEVDDPETVASAHLEVSAKLTASNPDGASYDYQVLAVADSDWSEADLTWHNAPARGAADGELAGEFTMDGPLDQVERIRVDVTGYVHDAPDGVITFIILDAIGQDGNLDSYSKERSAEDLRPGLRVIR